MPELNRTNVRWSIVMMLMAFSFMNYFNRISMSVAGDQIRSMYRLSETQLGTVFSALIVAYMGCMVVGGYVSDRIGGWRALTAMGLGTAFFTAATGLLPQLISVSQPLLMLSMLWVVRASLGAFTSPLYPASGRIVARWIPFRQRAAVNALVTGVGMLGIALTYPLFRALMKQVGLTNAFLITGAITALIAIVWRVCGRDEPHEHPRVSDAESNWIRSDQEPLAREVTLDSQPVRRGKNLLHNRSMWILCFSYATVGYLEYLVFYWSDHYFKHVLKFTEAGSTLAAMIPPLCMGLCMPLGGWISDRLVPVMGYRAGRAVVAALGMVGCSGMLVLATLVQNDMAIVACFALALASIGITEAPAWATAIELGGRSSATSAAIVNTGGNLGGALSPTITPWLSAMIVEQFSLPQEQAWAWALRFACLVCVVGALLWIGIDASERSGGGDNERKTRASN